MNHSTSTLGPDLCFPRPLLMLPRVNGRSVQEYRARPAHFSARG